MDTTLQEIFPTLLPVVRCDCCGEHFRDEVAEVMVVDAIVSFFDELVASRDREHAAWDEALARSDQALAEAQRGQMA